VPRLRRWFIGRKVSGTCVDSGKKSSGKRHSKQAAFGKPRMASDGACTTQSPRYDGVCQHLKPSLRIHEERSSKVSSEGSEGVYSTRYVRVLHMSCMCRDRLAGRGFCTCL
jgi:hypothetical protein